MTAVAPTTDFALQAAPPEPSITRDPAEPALPPRAPVVEERSVLHGDLRLDEYRWLRDADRPEVMAYLEAENAWTERETGHTCRLRDQLYREMVGRMRESDLSVPCRDRGWWYYTRTEAGKSYPVFCRRRESLEAPEEVYLDQNERAAGAAYHELGGMEVSPDGRLLLFLEDTTARRDYTLYVKDLASGDQVDRLDRVWNGTAWAEDGRSFFYVTADASRRAEAVWRHVLGTPRSADTLVYREPDLRHGVTLIRSRSGRYVFIASEGFSSAEWWYLPTAEPAAAPRLIAPRRPGVEYAVDHAEGAFFILTNEAAVNFRLMRAPEGDPAPAGWVEWLPHREEVCLEGFEAFREWIVLSERVDGLRRIRGIHLATGESREVPFDEATCGVFPAVNPEFDTPVFRYTCTGFTTPPSVYDYDFASGARTLLKRQEIPGGFEPARYETLRLTIPARDGAAVPVSLLRPRGAPRDGTVPLLLHAYGAYGVSVEPTFNGRVLSLVDRGMAYAIAHVRGGQELGRGWYDGGRMLRKRATFEDFMDVAEGLVALGYTSPDRLAASGGSAGGLLMGVVANERPDLFRAIVADVPFVDVVNTMLDPTLPLTAQEWEQWGNPELEEQYRYLLGYSPYDNVRPQPYPWMLVTASLHDSQVPYWEPAKWVARLRARKTDGNPLLLRTSFTGGHSGASGRYERLREAAFRYAFILDAVGLAGPGRGEGQDGSAAATRQRLSALR